MLRIAICDDSQDARLRLRGGVEQALDKLGQAGEIFEFSSGLGLIADVQIALPETLSISDVDLCALLGNALDNAMEAAVKARDKRITLRCRVEKGC